MNPALAGTMSLWPGRRISRKCPENGRLRKPNSAGFLASRQNGETGFALACMPACPPTTSRPSPRRIAPCGSTPPDEAGSSSCKSRRSVPAQRNARLDEKLLKAARRREIDGVLVWRLDRWGRSVTDLLTTLQELEHLGVGFVSLTEALDLTTPAGRAMAGLLAVFAEFEGRSLRT